MARHRSAPEAQPLPHSLGQLLAAKEIAIACGPGGVGKTTTAAAVAAMAVVEDLPPEITVATWSK